MWVRLEDARLEAIAQALDNAGLTDDAAAVRKSKEEFDDPIRKKYREAMDDNTSDGDLEMDDDAVVALGDDPGAYVMCWKWVDALTAGIEDGQDDGDDVCDTCGRTGVTIARTLKGKTICEDCDEETDDEEDESPGGESAVAGEPGA